MLSPLFISLTSSVQNFCWKSMKIKVALRQVAAVSCLDVGYTKRARPRLLLSPSRSKKIGCVSCETHERASEVWNCARNGVVLGWWNYFDLDIGPFGNESPKNASAGCAKLHVRCCGRAGERGLVSSPQLICPYCFAC